VAIKAEKGKSKPARASIPKQLLPCPTHFCIDLNSPCLRVRLLHNTSDWPTRLFGMFSLPGAQFWVFLECGLSDVFWELISCVWLWHRSLIVYRDTKHWRKTRSSNKRSHLSVTPTPVKIFYHILRRGLVFFWSRHYGSAASFLPEVYSLGSFDLVRITPLWTAPWITFLICYLAMCYIHFLLHFEFFLENLWPTML
jgi:hypothetical protein